MNNKYKMNIKLDEETYNTFVKAAETVSKSGVKVPIAQLAEVIINTELTKMDSKKIAKKFLKSLMSQFTHMNPEKEDQEKFYEN